MEQIKNIASNIERVKEWNKNQLVEEKLITGEILKNLPHKA